MIIELTTKKVIEKCFESGLVSFGDTAYFTWRGCDYCNGGKGADVYDCQGAISLLSGNEQYDFRLCGECINDLYYGEVKHD